MQYADSVERGGDRFELAQALLELLKRRHFSPAPKLPQQIIRERHAGHRRSRLQLAVQGIRNIANLDHLGHVLSVVACATHVKRCTRRTAVDAAQQRLLLLRRRENGVEADTYTKWNEGPARHDLLTHEFNHSWDGKYRRAADQDVPTLNMPLGGTLLWVYEGQTQYWGYVLTARAGLVTREQALDALAITAAVYQHRAGREWKSLQDTTNDPIIAARRPIPWRSWQRSEDYYSEGELVWLDVDTLIRELSGEQRSLDDFARAFFGVDDGIWAPETYTFDDVVKALTDVQPYSWAEFLRSRLESHGGPPFDGIARGATR